MVLIFEQMLPNDVEEVLKIEKESFPTPWSRGAFIGELTQNPLALYLVGKFEGRLVCYAGAWLIHGEAHITNIAVAASERGKGCGEAMCRALLAAVYARGATKATLEVRLSNLPAQSLYQKLGFRAVGVRPGYYTDTNEDALIMWQEDLASLVEVPHG